MSNLTGYAVTTVAGSEAQGSTNGPGLNASFQYLLGTKWHCNSSSKVCGALVADQNSNAVRFVAMFNYRRTETRSVTFAPSSVSVATVASVTPTVVVQYRKPTFTQSAWPGSSSLSLRKESALTQTKSERHFLTSARKVTRSASATRARSAAASRALPEETLSEQTSPEQTLPEQTLREQTVAVQQSLVLVSITASENADHTPSSRHTHTLPRVHLTATKSLPHEQRFDHSIASTWMSRDLLVSAAKSLSLVSLSVEDYCGTPDIELVPALRLFENSSESVTIRHAIQGNGPGETSLTVSDLCSVGGSINCVLVDPQGESSSSWTIVLEAANASKTVHIVFGFVAPILWTLDSAVAEGEITTLIPIVDDVTSSLHQRGFVSLSALGDFGYTTMHLHATCGRMATNVSVRVWSAPFAEGYTVATSTDVATTVVSAAAAVFGGDVVSATSLVLLTMLSCEHQQAPSAGRFIVSVLYDEGPVAMVLGNICIALLVTALHASVVIVASRRDAQTFSEVAGRQLVRFPALSLRVSHFLLPGTAFAVFLSFWSSSSGTVVVGVVGALVMTAFIIAEWLLWQHRILPQCSFVTTVTGARPAARRSCTRVDLLLPSGHWEPISLRYQYSALFSAFAPGRVWLRMLFTSNSIMMGAVAAAAVSGASGCRTGAWLAGAVNIFMAAAVVGLRPFVIFSETLFAPCGFVSVAVGCFLKADGMDDAADAVTTAVAALQGLRLLTRWMVTRSKPSHVELAVDRDEKCAALLHSSGSDDLLGEVELFPAAHGAEQRPDTNGLHSDGPAENSHGVDGLYDDVDI